MVKPMSLRYRWHSLSVPKGLDLDELIKTKDRGEDDGRFDDCVLANGDFGYRFVWHRPLLVASLTDSGEVSGDYVKSIAMVEFKLERVDDTRLLLGLVDPARSARALFFAFETFCGVGFSTKPVDFVRGHPLSIASSVDSVKMTAVKFSTSTIASGVFARIEIASPRGITAEDLTSIPCEDCSVHRATYEFGYKGKRGTLTFSRGGSVRISGDLAPRIFRYVERDIRELARGKSLHNSDAMFDDQAIA